MSISTPSTLNQPDPGQLMGGVRNSQVTLNGVVAEFLREANQNQDVFQTSRAFSGAINTNNLTQAEEIKQGGTSSNLKEVNLEPPSPGNIPDAFRFNYLHKVITDVDAAAYLARGLGNNQQNQLGGQSGFSSMLDFDGNVSQALNNLFQDEMVEQNLELTEVRTKITVPQPDYVWNNARFREVRLDMDDQDAQAILNSEQRQGYTTNDAQLAGNKLYDNPVAQFGATDGAFTQNNLSQSVQGKQTNTVLMDNTYDLRRNPLDALSPRTTDIIVQMNAEGGSNRAVNSESATQSQALVQQAHGGVDEFGNPTENGGTVLNNATQFADMTEFATVEHITNVLA